MRNVARAVLPGGLLLGGLLLAGCTGGQLSLSGLRAVPGARGARHVELRFLTAAYADHLAERAGEPGGCRGAYETIVS